MFTEKMTYRGLSAIAQAESLRYKLTYGLPVRKWVFLLSVYTTRACYGILRFIMESGARGAEVIVSGKIKGQRAKSMKFTDGLMIHSGDPVNSYIDKAVRHVLLPQGVSSFVLPISLVYQIINTLSHFRNPWDQSKNHDESWQYWENWSSKASAWYGHNPRCQRRSQSYCSLLRKQDVTKDLLNKLIWWVYAWKLRSWLNSEAQIGSWRWLIWQRAPECRGLQNGLFNVVRFSHVLQSTSGFVFLTSPDAMVGA